MARAPPRPRGRPARATGPPPRRIEYALALDGRLHGVGADEIRDRLVGVEAQEGGVLLHEGAGEEAAGQDVEPVLLEGLEEAQADLGAVRDLAQAHAAQFALPPQLLSERAHGFRFLGPGTKAAAARF